MQSGMNSFPQAFSPRLGETHDLTKLPVLNEEELLRCIKERYNSNHIYTNVGAKILVAVNPYQLLPIYTKEAVQRYHTKPLESLPPHIFAIAQGAFVNLKEFKRNQSLIISGDSGSGKTETVKLVLQYLAAITNAHSEVEQMILETSPILEAFGNAKTACNDNSSRYGKFLELQFDDQSKISGARVTQYLLEKTRIARQGAEERNFHIFYQLCAGAPDDMKQRLHLRPAADFLYLNQSGCLSISGIDDNEQFERTRTALQLLGMHDQLQDRIFGLLSAVLHLGQVKFLPKAPEGSTIANPEEIDLAASLLELSAKNLKEFLTVRLVSVRNEVVQVPLTVAQASDARDALSKTLYRRLFDWLVRRINRVLCRSDAKRFIGLLDIFGFEKFRTNNFEQLCINYANEKLQHLFHSQLFESEQNECEGEGIVWQRVQNRADNRECLEMFERPTAPPGLFALLDEECRLPKSTDAAFFSKVQSLLVPTSKFISRSRAANCLSVKHYAGDVEYHIEGFLVKNKDQLTEDLVALLLATKNTFLRELFEADLNNVRSSLHVKHHTVCNTFKKQLSDLMTLLASTYPWYVRCLRPNPDQKRAHFDDKVVALQLHNTGMLDTVRVRQVGYAVRLPLALFESRYISMLPVASRGTGQRERCERVLQHHQFLADSAQVGKTKVFLREQAWRKLEDWRQAVINRRIVLVQALWKGVRLRLEFLRKRAAAVTLQAIYRRHRGRMQYLYILEATRVLQAASKMLVAQKEWARRLQQYRAARTLQQKLEQERRRAEEEQRRKEEKAKRKADKKEKKRQKREAEEREKELARLANEKRQAEETAARLREEEEKRRLQEEMQLEQRLSLHRPPSATPEPQQGQSSSPGESPHRHSPDLSRSHSGNTSRNSGSGSQLLPAPPEPPPAPPAAPFEDEDALLAEILLTRKRKEQELLHLASVTSENRTSYSGSAPTHLELPLAPRPGSDFAPLPSPPSASHSDPANPPSRPSPSGTLSSSSPSLPSALRAGGPPLSTAIQHNNTGSFTPPLLMSVPISLTATTDTRLSSSGSWKATRASGDTPLETRDRSGSRVARGAHILGVTRERGSRGGTPPSSPALSRRPNPTMMGSESPGTSSSGSPRSIATSLASSLAKDSPLALASPLRSPAYSSAEPPLPIPGTTVVASVITEDMRASVAVANATAATAAIMNRSPQVSLNDAGITRGPGSMRTSSNRATIYVQNKESLRARESNALAAVRASRLGRESSAVAPLTLPLLPTAVVPPDEGLHRTLLPTLLSKDTSSSMNPYFTHGLSPVKLAQPLPDLLSSAQPLITSEQNFAFLGFAKKYFHASRRSRTTAGEDSAPLAADTSYLGKPMKRPLLQLGPELSKQSLIIFSQINMYLQAETNNADPWVAAKAVLKPGVLNAPLRDEIFCQLMKQSSGNPSKDSLVRVLELIAYCASSFTPSAALQPYLAAHLRSLAAEPRTERHAQFALQRLERGVATNVLRKQVLTIHELEALKDQQAITLRLHVPGFAPLEMPVDPAVTAAELIDAIAIALGLPETVGLSLMLERQGGALEPLSADYYVASTNPTERLHLRRHIFLRPRDYPDEDSEARLLYGQVKEDLATGRLVCTIDEAFELAALLRHQRRDKKKKPFDLSATLSAELLSSLSETECAARLDAAADALGLAEKSPSEAKIMFLFKAIGHEWFGSIIAMVTLAPEDAAQQPLGLPAQFVLALNREGVHALHLVHGTFVPIWFFAWGQLKLGFDTSKVQSDALVLTYHPLSSADVYRLRFSAGRRAAELQVVFEQFQHWRQVEALFATAVRDYIVDDPELLSFTKGAVIEITEKNFASMWFTGRCGGRYGTFPSEHVQVDDADVLPSAVEMTAELLEQLEQEKELRRKFRQIGYVARQREWSARRVVEAKTPQPYCEQSSSDAMAGGGAQVVTSRIQARVSMRLKAPTNNLPPPPAAAPPSPPSPNSSSAASAAIAAKLAPVPASPPTAAAVVKPQSLMAIRQRSISAASAVPAVVKQMRRMTMRHDSISGTTAADALGRLSFENYASQFLAKSSVPMSRLLAFTPDPPKSPLHPLLESLQKPALELLLNVMKFMGDFPEPKRSKAALGQMIVQAALSELPLRDELYAFLIKQTSVHPNQERLQAGWQLWCLCARFFTPSDRFLAYVGAYLQLNISMNTPNAKLCFERLVLTKHSGTTRMAVSLKEVHAVISRGDLTCDVHLADNSLKQLLVDTATTVAEVSYRLAKQLKLTDYGTHSRWGMFESHTDGRDYWYEALLVPQENILEAAARLKSHKPPKGVSGTVQSQLVFRKVLFLPDPADDTESQAPEIQQLLYEQAVRTIARSQQPVSEEDAVKLGALILQHQYGDYKRFGAVDVPNALEKELWNILPSHYVQLDSKLVWLPKLIMAYAELHGKSRPEAVAMYMDRVQSWHLYGCCLWPIQYAAGTMKRENSGGSKTSTLKKGDGTIRRDKEKDKQEKERLERQEKENTSCWLAFHPDGLYILRGYQKATIRMWPWTDISNWTPGKSSFTISYGSGLVNPKREVFKTSDGAQLALLCSKFAEVTKNP